MRWESSPCQQDDRRHSLAIAHALVALLRQHQRRNGGQYRPITHAPVGVTCRGALTFFPPGICCVTRYTLAAEYRIIDHRVGIGGIWRNADGWMMPTSRRMKVMSGADLFSLTPLLALMMLASCMSVAPAEALRRQVLRGYEHIMVSDYASLVAMLAPGAALHGVDGQVVDRAKLVKLAERVAALRRGDLPADESVALQAFLAKREDWGRRARDSVRFEALVIDGDSAVVTTFDSGTPGKLEKSMYSFRHLDGVWLVEKELSTHVAEGD